MPSASPPALHALRIALIGTGAIGSALCELLARAGLPHLLLIDPDVIAPRNFPISPFLAEAVERQAPEAGPAPHKAELLATHVRRSFGLPWRAEPVAIADVGWQILQECDLLCCCVDSALARVEIALAARRLQKPMLDGAVLGQGHPEGRVTWFAPAPSAACFLCGLSADRRGQLLAYATSASLGCKAVEDTRANTAHLHTIQHTAHALFRRVQYFADARLPDHSCAERRTASQDDPHTSTAASGRSEHFHLQQSQTCPWHDGSSGQLVSLPLDTPIASLLAQHSNSSAAPGHHCHARATGKVLELAWPVCTGARCRHCGFESEPRMRLAHVRRAAVCARCGQGGTLEPLAVVSSITQNSHAATQTLRQLGQPGQHLFVLRDTYNVEIDTQ